MDRCFGSTEIGFAAPRPRGNPSKDPTKNRKKLSHWDGRSLPSVQLAMQCKSAKSANGEKLRDQQSHVPDFGWPISAMSGWAGSSVQDPRLPRVTRLHVGKLCTTQWSGRKRVATICDTKALRISPRREGTECR